MPKTLEKEPLLFVDTMYKGCFVQEQSFFKTPTQKPQDIAATNYVHNYDQVSESSFKHLIPSNVTIHEVVEEVKPTHFIDKETKLNNVFAEQSDETLDYETVNILVDYANDKIPVIPFQENPRPINEAVPSFYEHNDEMVADFDSSMNEDDDFNQSSVNDDFDFNQAPMNDDFDFNQVPVSDDFDFNQVPVSDDFDFNQAPVSDDFDFNQAPVSDDFDFNQVPVNEDFDFVESPLNNGAMLEKFNQQSPDALMDDKQKEIMLFIQELANQSSMMKAPIVQIVKKDGTLKSGVIHVVDDQMISIDNLMDDIDMIHVKDVDGIRILHL